MIEIDIENWERKNHYLFFLNMDYPHYNLCFDVEITDFLSSLKQRNIPFYYAMIYIATRSANAVEAFRYRIRDNKIVLHDELFPSFTYLKKGEELFKMVTLAMEDDLEEFVKNAQEKSMNSVSILYKVILSGRIITSSLLPSRGYHLPIFPIQSA